MHKRMSPHGDSDHIGESINLVNNYKVAKVIFNCGPYNNLEKELIKVLEKKNIKYHSCTKELNMDNNKLYFLQTKEYDNENDNSNVIYIKMNEYKFIFFIIFNVFCNEKVSTVWTQLTCSHLRLLSNLETDSINCFIKDTINKNLSVRELELRLNLMNMKDYLLKLKTN